MEKGKPHIEYDDFGAYEEYLEDICTGKGQDHGFVNGGYWLMRGGLDIEFHD